jgi:sulfur carrier protein
MSLRIRVNGEEREVATSSLQTLLQELRAPEEGVAVAVDGEVVPRSARTAFELREGSRVEILRAVGGG